MDERDELPEVQSTYVQSGQPSVSARCPHCQQEAVYTIDLQVHSNVPGVFPATCDNCGGEFRIDPSSVITPDDIRH